MQIKTCPTTVKTAGTHDAADEGFVEAIVAAYNVDSVGDQIIPGAFAKSLAKHASAGNRIPFVWSHQSDNLDSWIGEVVEAEERPEGLWVKARLDMEDPKAAKVFRWLKGRRVSQFSFAYTETDARPATKSSMPGALKELHELDIHECGPTMVGANPSTALLGVKRAGAVDPPCPTCGHGPEVKHADTAEVVAEQAQEPTSQEVAGASAGQHTPDHSAPSATVDASLDDRIEALVTAAMEKLLRNRPEVDTAHPAVPTNADDEATPSDPAAVQPAADGQPASDREPNGQGTAMNRLRPELALLEAEFDELTI